MITFTGESIRLGYTASRFQTGLTVKIDIWDNEMVQVVSGESMTELSGGFYYYLYSPSDSGLFTVRLYATDGVSPVTVFESFKVHGRQSPLFSKRGGGSMILREKDDSKTFERLDKKLESLSIKIDSIGKNISLIPLESNDIIISKVLKEVSEINIHIKELSELQLKNIDSNILADANDFTE